jgi:hypothetical protein
LGLLPNSIAANEALKLGRKLCENCPGLHRRRAARKCSWPGAGDGAGVGGAGVGDSVGDTVGTHSRNDALPNLSTLLHVLQLAEPAVLAYRPYGQSLQNNLFAAPVLS